MMNKVCECQRHNPKNAKGLCLQNDCELIFHCQLCLQIQHQNHTSECLSYEELQNQIAKLSSQISEISHLVCVNIGPKLDKEISKMKRGLAYEKIGDLILRSFIKQTRESNKMMNDFLQKFKEQFQALEKFGEESNENREPQSEVGLYPIIQDEKGIDLYDQSDEIQNKEKGNTRTNSIITALNPPPSTKYDQSDFESQISYNFNFPLNNRKKKRDPNALIQPSILETLFESQSESEQDDEFRIQDIPTGQPTYDMQRQQHIIYNNGFQQQGSFNSHLYENSLFRPSILTQHMNNNHSEQNNQGIQIINIRDIRNKLTQ